MENLASARVSFILGVVLKDLEDVKRPVILLLAIAVLGFLLLASTRDRPQAIDERAGDVSEAHLDLVALRVEPAAGDSTTIVIETRGAATDGTLLVGLMATFGDGRLAPPPYLLLINATHNGTAWIADVGVVARSFPPQSRDLATIATQTRLQAAAVERGDGLAVTFDLLPLGGERFADRLFAARGASYDSSGARIDSLDKEVDASVYVSTKPVAAPERVRDSVAGQLSFGAVVVLIAVFPLSSRLYAREVSRGTMRTLASYPIGLNGLHLAKAMSLGVSMTLLLVPVTILGAANAALTLPPASLWATLVAPLLTLSLAFLMAGGEGLLLANVAYRWRGNARQGPALLVPLIVILGMMTTLSASGTVVSIYSAFKREILGSGAGAQELADFARALTGVGDLLPFRLAGETATWLAGVAPPPGSSLGALVLLVLIAVVGLEAGRRCYVDVFFND